MTRHERETPPPTASAIAELPEVLTTEQAAWMLHMSEWTITDHAKRGTVPCRMIGKRRLFSKSALLAYIAAP